jgi:hypothetical protein
MSRETEAGAPQIDRRSFCGRALITSAGVVLTTKALSATPSIEQNLAVYPPQKIEGAERLVPCSFLYFNYPRRGKPGSAGARERRRVRRIQPQVRALGMCGRVRFNASMSRVPLSPRYLRFADGLCHLWSAAATT